MIGDSVLRLGLGVHALLFGCLALCTTACKCQDDSPKRSVSVRLTEEQQQAVDVDRVRFSLKTPEDYGKEAYLAIDEDNAKAVLESLRREIDAEFASNGPLQ